MHSAMRAWRAVRIVIEAYRRGVPGVGRAAVEHAIDNWYATCELTHPTLRHRIINRLDHRPLAPDRDPV